MKLSRTVDYAIQSAVLLAMRDGEQLSCNKIAELRGLPERFLLQILRTLCVAGVLKSTRGVQGGYLLARPAADITLRDIWEAIEGPIDLRTTCPELQYSIGSLTETIRAHLHRFTLADLAAEERREAQVPA